MAKLYLHVCSLGDIAEQVPSHSAVFINEPRLSEFKQLVVSKGIQAEMSGGVLICNNVIAVRRVRHTASYSLVVESSLNRILFVFPNSHIICVSTAEVFG